MQRTNSLSRSLATIAISLLGAAVGFTGVSAEDPYERRSRPQGWRNPFRSILSANRYSRTRHGERECARRRGDRAWASYRACDRSLRGMPPIHHAH